MLLNDLTEKFGILIFWNVFYTGMEIVFNKKRIFFCVLDSVTIVMHKILEPKGKSFFFFLIFRIMFQIGTEKYPSGAGSNNSGTIK